MSTEPPTAGVVSISALDVENRDSEAVDRVRNALNASFAADCPGLILVKDLKPWFGACRRKLLASILDFSKQPDDVKRKYEFSEVDYSVGWSHGREKFRGRTDTLKGSFYANPVYDDPANGNAELVESYPHLFTSNVWPSVESGESASMEWCFKKIGNYIADLGLDLAWHCDRFVEWKLRNQRADNCEKSFTKLHEFLRESRAQKGRLLLYGPSALLRAPARETHRASSDEHPSWFGFHNDHGLLTGLVAGEFYEYETGVELGNVIDEHAGLYVVPSDVDKPLRVVLPPDCVGFQTGETAQILTGGILRATPHCVKGPSSVGYSHDLPEGTAVCRASFAVFLQPNPDTNIELPGWDTTGLSALANHRLVPTLIQRYVTGDTFAAFGEKTVKAYLSVEDNT